MKGNSLYIEFDSSFQKPKFSAIFMYIKWFKHKHNLFSYIFDLTKDKSDILKTLKTFSDGWNFILSISNFPLLIFGGQARFSFSLFVYSFLVFRFSSKFFIFNFLYLVLIFRFSHFVFPLIFFTIFFCFIFCFLFSILPTLVLVS